MRIDATTGNVVIPQGLTVSGTFSMTGTYTGSVSAGNISSGDFGSNYSGGNFSFPANVGIGTTGPGAKLEISGTSDALRFLVDDSNTVTLNTNVLDREAHLTLASGGNITLTPYSSAQNVVISQGNVGIGTTSPGAKLDVVGNIMLSGGNRLITADSSDGADNRYLAISGGGSAISSRGSYIYFQGNEDASNPGKLILAAGNVATGDIVFRTGADDPKVTILANGNVGIGTTSPGTPLHVYYSDAAVYDPTEYGFDVFKGLKVENIDTTTNAYAEITLKAGNSNSAGGRILVANEDANAGSMMAFHTRSDTGGTNEWMRITNTGNVGIGTTNPGAALHVAPNNNNNDGDIKVGARAWFSHRDAGQTNTWIANDYNSNTATFGIRMKGVASGNEVLTVLGSGNVGIGTTSPGYKLDVYGASAAIRITGPSTDDMQIIGGVDPAKVGPTTNTQMALWANGAEVMRLKSGNVGIGYTDTSGNKLAVNGAIYSSSSITAASQFCFPGDCRNSW